MPAYGPPTVSRRVAGSINPDSLEARLIRCEITFLESSGIDGGPPKSVTKIQKLPRSFDIYRVKGIIGRLFGLRPSAFRLIWESGEWDPVEGYEEDISDSDSSEDDEDLKKRPKGKWIRREAELVDGTRDIGFWVEGAEARVRLELR